MTIRFEPEPGVGEVFRLQSLDCVAVARQNFGLAIEVDRESVRLVETMAGMLHDQRAEASMEAVEYFAKVLGGHIAHVFVSAHGWVPGKVFFDEVQTFGIQSPDYTGTLWPQRKAMKRLINGAEDNLWFYYVSTVDDLGPPPDLRRTA